MDPSHMTAPAIARETVDRYHMLSAESVVLAMVSGGGDSVALLHMLAHGELGEYAVLTVLHVDHGLRGAESRADARLVEATCAGLGVDCVVERVDVAAVAREEGLNLEDAGRRERYRLAETHLDRLCDAKGSPHDAGRIAVAHSRDDRVETFLMRLAQGAGATGLTSLRPVRGRIVRPLIGVARAHVRAYLDSVGQPWREDATNADTRRLRAKIRHEILPLMREINPRLDEALLRTLLLLADDDAFLAGLAASRARECVESDAEEVRFDREALLASPPALRRRVLREALSGSFPDVSRLDFEHVEALVVGLEKQGFAYDLPGGLRAFNEYDRMVVSRGGSGSEPMAPGLLPVPGICELGESGTMTAREVAPDPVDDDPLTAVIDADAISGSLEVGRIAGGERMRPLGMRGTRKVSDILVDAKVPRRWRAGVPVVRDRGTVVWLAGVRMSEEYRVRDDTERAVRLTWVPGKRDPRAAGWL